MSKLRVGIGVDAHAFETGETLVLGGVSFESDRGLAGHSDGDVLTHALIDAILGAARLGDLGSMFSSEDPELRGVSSLRLLRRAYTAAREDGFELVNADCVLVGEQPRIAPRRAAIERTPAEALDVEEGLVSVRATTTDGLGFTGRSEGLAAQAVALLSRSS